MSIAIYKPTAKNTGCAVSFQVGYNDEYLYVNLIKQFSWNPEKKTGSFSENRKKPGFFTTLKFNQVEAGAWLDAIERFYTFSPYHGTDERGTRISFGLAEVENPTTFVFSVSQTNKQDTSKKASFFIPITFGEARLIREYLIHYLHRAFDFNEQKTSARATQSSELDVPFDGANDTGADNQGYSEPGAAQDAPQENDNSNPTDW